MISSLLTMNQSWKDSLLLLRDLSQDIHCQLGDIDKVKNTEAAEIAKERNLYRSGLKHLQVVLYLLWNF